MTKVTLDAANERPPLPLWCATDPPLGLEVGEKCAVEDESVVRNVPSGWSPYGYINQTSIIQSPRYTIKPPLYSLPDIQSNLHYTVSQIYNQTSIIQSPRYTIKPPLYSLPDIQSNLHYTVSQIYNQTSIIQSPRYTIKPPLYSLPDIQSNLHYTVSQIYNQTSIIQSPRYTIKPPSLPDIQSNLHYTVSQIYNQISITQSPRYTIKPPLHSLPDIQSNLHHTVSQVYNQTSIITLYYIWLDMTSVGYRLLPTKDIPYLNFMGLLWGVLSIWENTCLGLWAIILPLCWVVTDLFDMAISPCRVYFVWINISNLILCFHLIIYYSSNRYQPDHHPTSSTVYCFMYFIQCLLRWQRFVYMLHSNSYIFGSWSTKCSASFIHYSVMYEQKIHPYWSEVALIQPAGPQQVAHTIQTWEVLSISPANGKIPIIG